MSGLLPQLGLVFVLVLINALLAGSELALVSLREVQLQRLERQSAKGKALAKLARDPNRYLATIQIGLTLAGFLASAAAAVTLAEPLEGPLDFLGRFAPAAAIVIVTLILSYFTLVLGELAPKRLAMQRAEGWAMVAARPLAVLAEVTRPVVWLLSHSTDMAVRVLGGDPDAQREQVTDEELRSLVAAHEGITQQQRLIMSGAFEIAERTLHEVLRPRGDVVVLAAEQPCQEGLDKLAASGFSRAPVATGGNLDDVVGLVHLRDLLDCQGETMGQRAQPAAVFPESLGVLDALRQLQLQRQQLAVVLNEHGGAEGIVTVEDLVEELVGEIYDETDRDILSVHHDEHGALIMPGRFPVHDLPDLGVELPEGAYATLAGFVLDRLGRVPEVPGDVVVADGWQAEVLAVSGRAITQIRLSRTPPAASAD